MSVVMGVLILSFAVWGIADIFKGFGQSTLAKIGRTEISTDQFRQIYTEKLQQIGRQFGRPLTQDQARAFGIDRQVLQQVVAEAALDENARRLGLGQSDAETMRMIYSDPNFKGPTGAFDAGRFQQTIRQFGYTEQRYIADQRRVALRRQIAGTITTGLEPSKTLVEAMSRFQSEQRAIDYLKLEAAQIGAIEPPSSEALAGFYEDHKSQFRAPEYRKLSFVTVTPEAIAKWASVSDEDARKVFEQRREKLATPERRQVSQIVFQNGEEAQSARTRIAGGLSFDDLVKERNLSSSDVDLGNVTKAGIIDPKVADAAFALPVDEVSQPVQGRFGVALIKVGKIEPGIQPSYESVAAALKRDIATERARAEVQDLHNKMEDARGGGASVIESSQRLGLTPVTIEAIDRSGRGPDGQPVAGIPQGIDLASAAFASDVGVDNESLPVAGGYLWFDVLGITPSRERSLDDVKAQVESRWRTEQVTSRLRTRAAEMVRKLAQGGTLADEAKAAGVKLETATGLKRDGAVPGVPTAVIEAAFKTLKDGVGQTQGGTGAEWFVFRVTDVTVPPLDLASEDARKIKDSLIRRMGDEQVGQHVARLETEIGTTINEAAVAQVTGAATN
jgi:peptidyl-prolyl cis-trans isomerase D